MKFKNIFLLSLFLIIFGINVYAIDTNNLVHYYNFNNNSYDSLYKLNATVTGVTNTTGKLNGGYLFAGSTTSYLNFGSGSDFYANNKNISYSFWFNITTCGSYPTFLSKWTAGAGLILALDDTSCKPNYIDNTAWRLTTNPISINTWYHEVFTYNIQGTTYNTTLYINGVQVISNNIIMRDGTGYNFLMGRNTNTDTNAFSGVIDEFAVFNKSLSLSEVNELYNGGIGLSYPFSTSTTNFTITNTNNYNSLNIASFNAIINGTTYNTTVGILITPFLSNSTTLKNITITSNNMFNKTYINVNLSSNLSSNQDQYPIIYLISKWDNTTLSNFSLLIDGNYYNTTTTFNYLPFNTTKTVNTVVNNYFNTTNSLNLFQNTINQINVTQSEIILEVKEFDSNISLKNWTINITGYNNLINVSGYNTTIYPNAKTYNISKIIDNTNNEFYQLAITNFTVNPLDNKTITLYVYVHTINVSAKNILTNSSITNFTIILTDLTDGSDNRNFTTTTGNILIPVVHHNYNITIDGSGFALYNNSKIFNITNNVNTIFYLYTTNSLLFNIYDLSTGLKLNQTVDIELNGLSNYYKFNATNGSVYIDNIVSDYYKITSSSSGYNDIVFYITLTDREFRTINVYFSTGITLYRFITYDYSNLLTISNATITMFENVGGNLVTFQQLITDFSGSANFYLETGRDYSFTVDKSGYKLFTGIVNPVVSPYNIYLTKDQQEFSSVFDDIFYNTNSVRSGNDVNFTFILSSSSGSLSWFSVKSNYSGVIYNNNITTSSSGGTAEISIPIGASNSFTVEYSFKSSLSSDIISFTNNYYIGSNSVINQNNTFSDGLFNDIKNDTSAFKGFFGMIIILLFVVIIYSISNSLTASSLGGVFGLGICYYFSLMPRNYLIISIIVLIVMLIADNFEGGQ